MLSIINEKKRLLAMVLAMLLVMNPLALPVMSVQASEVETGISQNIVTLSETEQSTVSNGDNGTNDGSNIDGDNNDGSATGDISGGNAGSVIKKDQNLWFEETGVEVTYGTHTYANPAYLTEEDGVEYPDSSISYTIVEGSNIAEIDDMGTLYFQSGAVGTVVVAASKEGDSHFNDGYATYTLEVVWEQKPTVTYTLTDEAQQTLSIDEWNTGKVYIRAPKEWNISDSCSLDGNEWRDCLIIDEEGSNIIRDFYLQSEAGGITEKITVEGIKIDNSDPTNLTVTYSTPIYEGGGVGEFFRTIYYNFTNQVCVTLEATDCISGVDRFAYYDSTDRKGKRTEINAELVDDSTDTYQASFWIREKYADCITFDAIDNAGNVTEMYDKVLVVVDGTAPTFDVEYSQWALATSVSSGDVIADYVPQTSTDVNLYYNQDAVLQFQIEEEHFFANDITLLDNDTEVSSNKIDWSCGKGKDKDVWTGKYTIPVADSGEHVLELEYHDRSQNGTVSYTSEHIIMDKDAPAISVSFDTDSVKTDAAGVQYFGDSVQMQISVCEENFMAQNVDIVLNAYDGNHNTVSGCDVGPVKSALQSSANWTCEVNEAGKKVYSTEITFDQNATYEVTISCKDLADNEAMVGPVTFVVDNVAPTVEQMRPEDRYHLGNGALVLDAFGNVSDVIDNNSRFIYAANTDFTFAIRENNFFPQDVKLIVTRDNVELVNQTDYLYDYSTDWKEDTEDEDVNILTLNLGQINGAIVDGDYQVIIQYCDRSGKAMETFVSQVMTVDTTKPSIAITYDNNVAKYDKYYKEQRTATIVVTDRNITGGQIVTTVSSCDAVGNAVDFDLNVKQSDWVKGVQPHTWESTIIYDVDANYGFQIVCTDTMEHSTSMMDAFVVDKTAPSNTTFQFEYSNPFVEKVLSALSFGFYNPDVTVKITAEDVTSPIDYFVWNYTKQDGAGDVNISSETHTITSDQIVYDEEKNTASAEFTLTATEAAQYRGYVTFSATDKAGNSSPYMTDTNHIVVVDTISPTRTVAYSPAKQVVSKDDMRTLENFSYVSENTNAILYYDAPMTMTFRVREENFFAEDPVVKVNGTEVAVNNWSKSGNEWVGILSLSKDGSYVVTFEYMDNSQNKMQTYTSEEIIIDVTNPIIEVAYSPDNMVQQIGDIKYYGEKQTATIVITESNFRAWDVNAIVTAKNAAGEDVAVEDYAAYLRNSSSWVHDGNKHTATITFANDANYTFDIEYMDLVQREANDVPLATFTVDTVAPSNLTMSYSTSIVDMVLEGITFGFYNAPVTVTVTAEDETSGVNRFEYSYIKASGVSDVNAEATNIAIPESEIVYSNGRKTATATFQVPNSALNADNQFNGKVEFVANDCVNLNTKYVDEKRIIVDNIAPNVQVEFSQSANTVKDTYYFNGAMQATIHVTEANFYAEDVKVSVSKDGGNANEINVAWSDQSVDNHTGTFTLSEDGEYVVYITYTDRSTNEAAAYQSGRLIVDTIKPLIRVKGVKNSSANKEALIGFVLTVEDVNMNGSSITPSLMAEVKEADGTIRVVDMSALGQLSTVVAGKNYIYTVTNLERDAIYNLECSASDMAGNETTEIVIEDSGDELASTLQFSVNREGSTYALSELTRELNGNFSNTPRDIEIREINPNELTNIKLTLFKNDKTVELQEGRDYTVDFEGGNGSWYLYDYTVYEENFEDDGIYRLAIYSEDAAGNVSQNTLDVKDVEISFGIDKTAPNLIIANLEENETYPVENLTVIMQATDNIKLDSVEVQLDGKEHARWEQEEIEQKNANLEDFTFNIAGDVTKAHTVEVVLTDLAGNRTVKEVGEFYVTTNMLVRVMNSSVLPVAGAVTATGGVGAAAVVHGVKIGRFRRFRKF